MAHSKGGVCMDISRSRACVGNIPLQILKLLFPAMCFCQCSSCAVDQPASRSRSSTFICLQKSLWLPCLCRLTSNPRVANTSLVLATIFVSQLLRCRLIAFGEDLPAHCCPLFQAVLLFSCISSIRKKMLGRSCSSRRTSLR